MSECFALSLVAFVRPFSIESDFLIGFQTVLSGRNRLGVPLHETWNFGDDVEGG